MFAKKKAAFQNRAATDQVPRFLARDAGRDRSCPPRQAGLRGSAKWVDRAKQLSAVFAPGAGLDASEVWISEAHGTSFYLNSEGFKVVTPVSTAYLRISAEARADDGMTVPDVFAAVENRFEDLPPMADFQARAARWPRA